MVALANKLTYELGRNRRKEGGGGGLSTKYELVKED